MKRVVSLEAEQKTNIFEVFLLQDGEKEACHGIITVGRHFGQGAIEERLRGCEYG